MLKEVMSTYLLNSIPTKLPFKNRVKKAIEIRDFPGGPVAKILCSQCRGPRFNPWSEN